MTTKICTKCKQKKKFSEFGKEKLGKFGLRGDCKLCRKKQRQEYYQKNRTELRKKGNKRAKKYYAANKEICIQNQIAHDRKRYYSDELFRIKYSIRRRLNLALKVKNFNKTKGFSQYIGCSAEELKIYLELQFGKGMSWDNYGEWHIDHIVPLNEATNVDEMYELCHFSNLQPLWASDNISKGANYDY